MRSQRHTYRCAVSLTLSHTGPNIKTYPLYRQKTLTQKITIISSTNCCLADDDKVNQILFVTHTEGTQATAELYVKVPEENNSWVMEFSTDAYIGIDQMGVPNEQSGYTPLGDYGIGNAFGIRKNPGTSLNYIDITPTTFACDEDCEYYNQIIDIKETGHDCKGEEMYKYSPEYNYGLQTATNPGNEYNKGSNLFIHCKGAKPFTMGCVALDEEYMITVLKKADPGMRVYYSEMYMPQ